jgi:hypothetical protein
VKENTGAQRDPGLLSQRGLALQVDDDARLAACADLGPLERWLDHALTAATAAEALL